MSTNIHVWRIPAGTLVVAVLVLAAATAQADEAAQRVWLDELDVAKATCGWGKARANRSVEGKPLTVGGQTFARGLGTHAPGRLVVQLDGRATRLRGRVGVDDEVAGRPSRGSVEFQVIGDGKVLWRSGVLRAQEPARELDVDLRGIRRVELAVTTGGDTYACDHADWADAWFEVAPGARIAAVGPAKPSRKTSPADLQPTDPPIAGRIVLADLTGAGAKVLEGFRGKPEEGPWGVLGTYDLMLPPGCRGVFYSHANAEGRGWPNMMNRAFPWPFTNDPARLARLNYGGIFFVLALDDGTYLAVTALAGAKTESWFFTDRRGRLRMSFGTFGTAAVACDVPLMAWGRSANLYEACHRAIAAGITCKPLAGRARLRGEKSTYYDYFNYLGWCSWEHFKGKISEENLLGAIDGIEASGLPVRYVLIDDGHTSNQHGAIDSFRPRPDKFPHGWAPLLARRRPDGIRWMGLWHDFRGYTNGIAPNNDFGEALNRHFERLSDTSLIVRNTPESALAFYRAFMGSVKDAGFNFVKTDFQSAQLAQLSGKVDNAVQRCAANSQAFETAISELGLGLINCNWHNPCNFFNCRDSCIGRCSIDYSKGSTVSAKRHLWQSYGNILWLGQLAWGDHDMFHSSHEGVGRIMAVSKAVSGGPVYLSDAPEAFVPDIIRPLCYQDGRLLRPLAPAAPLPDAAFVDPCIHAVPYRVIAPLPRRCAAVVLYNLYTGKGEPVVKAEVAAADYASAGGMIQPYAGPWQPPEEGLVVYDWSAGTARRLEGSYTVDLAGFTDRLLHLCPIRHGWAVIGRTDKYLSPAAVEVVSISDTEVTMRMVEAGPLAVWTSRGTPQAEGVTFVARANGLYTADLPVGERGRTLTIRR